MRIDEELAQLFHLRRIDCLLKFDTRIPGAESVVPSEKKLQVISRHGRKQSE